MNPLTPHLSEELHERDDERKKLVSASSWPEIDKEKINYTAEAGEELVKTAMEGMRNVLKLAKLDKPTKFTFFIAERWLYELFNVLAKEMHVTRNVGEIMKKVLAVEEHKMKGKEISKIVAMVVKDVSKLPALVTSQEEEFKVISEAKVFLEKEIGCKIEVIIAEEGSEEKAKSAWPGKVGILVE